MDVPSDDPERVSTKTLLVLNRRRLAFYERHGAHPILGTIYDVPEVCGRWPQPKREGEVEPRPSASPRPSPYLQYSLAGGHPKQASPLIDFGPDWTSLVTGARACGPANTELASASGATCGPALAGFHLLEHTATLVGDRVVVVGPDATADLYDRMSGAVTTAPLVSLRTRHTAALQGSSGPGAIDL